jgi:hypothetical protein
MQCFCQGCRSRSGVQGSDSWLISLTEFERHSGMSTAKKWRTRCGSVVRYAAACP